MLNFLREVLRQHPTLLLTLCYLLITLIGVVYSYYFYAEFGINIVQFADVSDFLLASILELISIIIFFAVGAFTFVMFLLDFWLRKKLPAYGRWTQNKMASRYTDPIIFTLVVGTFVVLYVRDFAVLNADQIKGGAMNEFSVKMADGEQERALNLLGNTSRFTYLYDYALGEVLIVPVENVASLKKM
ncbi:MAG: hypothetical protein RL120_06615 [Gammaproteobacteria bacterium]